MKAIDTILFQQFADALNGDLVAIGATIRVARDASPPCGALILNDGSGRPLGCVPDYVDAATIKAFEAIIMTRDALPCA